MELHPSTEVGGFNASRHLCNLWSSEGTSLGGWEASPHFILFYFLFKFWQQQRQEQVAGNVTKTWGPKSPVLPSGAPPLHGPRCQPKGRQGTSTDCGPRHAGLPRLSNHKTHLSRARRRHLLPSSPSSFFSLLVWFDLMLGWALDDAVELHI